MGSVFKNVLTGRVLAELNPLEHVVAVPLFTVNLGHYELVVSNHMFMVALTLVLLLVFLPVVLRRPRTIPSRAQNLIETVCVYLRDQMARPVLQDKTDRYIGFLWSVFFFVLMINLLGMIPLDKILYLVSGRPNHLGGSATANIWVTGGLAVVVFFATHAIGIKEQGAWPYLVNIAPSAPKWLLPLIYPLELISHVVRPFTLAVRLFANIIAGHMVLATMLGLIFVFKHIGVAAISIAGCVALSFLELLVAFLQAYVFTFLATLYIGASVHPEH